MLAQWLCKLECFLLDCNAAAPLLTTIQMMQALGEFLGAAA